MDKGYALDELMVIEASRSISDWDIVMVGTGLPMVASLLALKNHAPHMCYVVETGPIAPEVIPTPSSVADARVMYRSVKNGSLIDSLGHVLQRGMADIGFIGGAQIDQFANVNSTVIGNYYSPKVRFPGSGGANDMASHSQKILIIAKHELRRFPANCDFITSPGYINGPDGRKSAGLPVRYPDILVFTNLAVMKIDKTAGKLVISKLMPGISTEEVQANTGFDLKTSNDSTSVTPPTQHELRLLRERVDPDGIYLKTPE